jgi:hypothetical protein
VFTLNVDDYPDGIPACLEVLPAAQGVMRDVIDALRHDREARRRGLRR